MRQAMANALTAIWQLDVIVPNHLAANPVAREVWKRSRRLVYPSKRRQLARSSQPTPPHRHRQPDWT